MENLYKHPRLYVSGGLETGKKLALPATQAHYLRSVMRRAAGDKVRLFNGRDGEWLGSLVLEGKRDASVNLEQQVKAQPVRGRRLHLFFTPLKKDRLDVLIEKAIELDATDLHPVISARTEVREIKPEKLALQMIEAAEQCERLDVPILHPLEKLDRKITLWKDAPVFAGLERSDAKTLCDALVPAGDVAALVGPVGGWTDEERAFLTQSTNVQAVSLGPNVLRSETAVAVMLARLSRP